MEYTSTTKQALNELQCVAADNAEVAGTYLSDPGSYEGDPTVFDDPRGQKEFAYTNVVPGDGNERGSAKVREETWLLVERETRADTSTMTHMLSNL